MEVSPTQPRLGAERRVHSDRRRVSLLEYAPDRRTSNERRCGFDRREILRILCHSCHKPLFGTRDEYRRLMWSQGYIAYLKDPVRCKTYACPHCRTRYEKFQIQSQQDVLLLRKISVE